MPSASKVQLARHYYKTKADLASSTRTKSKRDPKPLKGRRKVARAEREAARARQRLMDTREFAEYDLRVVSRRTIRDPDRTSAMEANEARLWKMCTACHKELGEGVYRLYLAKRIKRLEAMACSGSLPKDETQSFLALRRLVALLAQERVMLDTNEAQLKAAGFDGTFIALGRTINKRGFKRELGWYTEDELRACYEEGLRTAAKPEDLPVSESDI
ncbi:unnamed protein product [Peniophora sp. CBMAI 1063]|nr:unnamed protein product [Peniophora sp. CBMAI 1063]